jgi:hypothetical protein
MTRAPSGRSGDGRLAAMAPTLKPPAQGAGGAHRRGPGPKSLEKAAGGFSNRTDTG